jgi:hypothetical protein
MKMNAGQDITAKGQDIMNRIVVATRSVPLAPLAPEGMAANVGNSRGLQGAKKLKASLYQDYEVTGRKTEISNVKPSAELGEENLGMAFLASLGGSYAARG